MQRVPDYWYNQAIGRALPQGSIAKYVSAPSCHPALFRPLFFSLIQERKSSSLLSDVSVSKEGCKWPHSTLNG